MKNTAINNLEYTGIVTISQYIGSKKVELFKATNTGGDSLFNFLSDCLIGDFDAAALARPTKIMLLGAILNDDGTEEFIDMSGFIYLVSKPEKLSPHSIKYSFVIPRALVENVTGDVKYIGLYNNSVTELDLKNFAAKVEYGLNRNELLTSSMLVVDWILNITNTNTSDVNQ